MNDIERELLRDVLDFLLQGDNLFPEMHPFRIKHEKNRKLIDGLLRQGFLQTATQRYQLTFKGLRACDNDKAKREFERCNQLIPLLKDLYRKDPSRAWAAGEIKPLLASIGFSPKQYLISVTFLGTGISPVALLANEYDNGFTSRIRVGDEILDIEPFDWDTFSPTQNAPETATKTIYAIPERQLKKAQLSLLKLQGFKSIRHIEALQLGSLNILIGANGAGKSNFVSFFRFMGAMFEVPGELQLYTGNAGGANTFLFDQARVTPRIEAELSFTSDQVIYEYRATLSATAADTFIFADERYRSYLQTPRGWLHGADVGGKESGIYEAFVTGDADARVFLLLMREFAVYQFHDTSENARIRKNFSASDNKRLKSDGGNLAPFLLRLKMEHPKVYERITGTIRLIAPFFADFVLDPSNQNLRLQWRERGSDAVFGAHQASDGTLRVMALVALLLQPQGELPALIILDEPELGLHPYAIEVVAGLIKSASVHTQLIVATQSTALLNQFEPEDIIVVDRVNRETTFKRLKPEDLAGWLEDYSLSELWEKNVLGGRPSR